MPNGWRHDESKVKSWQQEFDKLKEKLSGCPWILKGSVLEILPPPGSPRARARYVWIRKVNQKTVTISLSKQQYQAFAKAIEANRAVEATLRKMREISRSVLLESSLVQNGKRKKKGSLL